MTTDNRNMNLPKHQIMTTGSQMRLPFVSYKIKLLTIRSQNPHTIFKVCRILLMLCFPVLNEKKEWNLPTVLLQNLLFVPKVFSCFHWWTGAPALFLEVAVAANITPTELLMTGFSTIWERHPNWDLVISVTEYLHQLTRWATNAISL